MNEGQRDPETGNPLDEARARRKAAVERMLAFKREVEVTENKTVGDLLDELKLSAAPILLEVSGEVFRPNEVSEKRLEKGDKVGIIPLIAGG